MLDPEVGLGLASGDRVGPSSLTLWGLPLPRPLISLTFCPSCLSMAEDALIILNDSLCSVTIYMC